MDNQIKLSPQEKLDVEFKETLRIIGSHISCVFENPQLSKYLMWLEKLTDVDENDRNVRNMYLIQLCKQIEIGKVEEPFLKTPPSGPLKPYSKSMCCQTIEDMQAECNTGPTPDDSPRTFIDTQNFASFLCTPTTSSVDSELFYQQTYYDTCFDKRFSIPISENSQIEIDRRFICNPNSQYFQVHQLQTFPQIQQNEALYECGDMTRSTQKLLQDSDIKIPEMQEVKTEKPIKKKKTRYTKSKSSDERFQSGSSSGTIKSSQLKTKFGFDRNKFIRKNADSDDSSWCDLTDVSETTLQLEIDQATFVGSGDIQKTNRSSCSQSTNRSPSQRPCCNQIKKLLNIIFFLKKENEKLNDQVKTCEKDLTLRNVKAETSIHNLVGEVACLRNRLKELTEIKTAIKETALYGSLDWKRRIQELENKIQDLQTENIILSEKLRKTEEQLPNEEELQSIAEIKADLTNIHNRQLEVVKEQYRMNMKQMEKRFTKSKKDTEETFKKAQNDLKVNYLRKIEEVSQEYNTKIKEKEAEIARLEELVENQCSKMQQEVQNIRLQINDTANNKDEAYNQKILFLKKCITKMDRLHQKSEKKYSKKISKLQKEIEIRDKTKTMLLTSQRASLIANLSSQTQEEVDAIFNDLEERYKQLLETQQEQAIEIANKDQQVIDNLRIILEKTMDIT